jgi:hypothetical protein
MVLDEQAGVHQCMLPIDMGGSHALLAAALFLLLQAGLPSPF